MISKLLNILIIAGLVVPVLGAELPIDQCTEIASPAVIFEALALNRDVSTPAKPKYLSPSSLLASPDGAKMYIGCESGKQVKIFDLATKAVKDSLLLPDEVTGMAISPDGTILIVTCSSKKWPAGKVCFVDVAAKKTVATIYTGFGARSPVLTPDGKKLYICNQFSNDVSVIDVATRSVTAKVKMVREPYCAAITPDGKTVVVGNLLPADLSTDSLTISSAVALIATSTNQVVTTIKLIGGATTVTDVTITPDGKYALLTHLSTRFNLLGSTVDAGHMVTNVCAFIDLPAKKLVNTITLDQATKGSGSTWAIKSSNDAKYLVVTHAGSHEISIIDFPQFIDSVNYCTNHNVNLHTKFNYFMDVRILRSTSSESPRAVEIVGDKLFTTGIFNQTPQLEQFSLSLKKQDTAVVYPLAQPVMVTPERKGEALFYDARLCFQSWQSCHTCHPFGGSSGLYNILNSGVACTPKNVKGLVYTWWTAPTTWSGRRPDAHESNVAAIQLELFTMPQDSNVNSLDAFLKNFQPTKSPVLDKGRFTAAAERGKALFLGDKAGCAKCHVPPLFSDGKLYSVEINDPFDASPMNTPSLIECWKTAPYGHLGSIGTVQEMIKLPGMSGGSTLTDGEVTDLEKYVLSL